MTQTFAPLAAVWEITMACNMRCRHCGSACTVAQPGELTTAEALTLCDELADMGLKMVTLSGGEPLLRHDWPDIARRFTDRGVVVMMISNGWFFNSQVIEKARDSGVESIGISLDGPEKTHDSIRQKGAFARVMRALEQMSKENFTSSVVTTVMKYNLFQLPEMKAILEETGVSRWQFQLGVPMGHLAKNRSQVIDPGQIQMVLDFIQTVLEEKKIVPFPADNIGYCTSQIMEIFDAVHGPGRYWRGCQAGKGAIGILHDGSIVGCTSLRDTSYIEGNVRKTPLREIWNRPGAFAWNRDLTREDLAGFCRTCRFGRWCLGGCSTLKRFTYGDMSQTDYCLFRQAFKPLESKIDAIKDERILLQRARKAVELKLYEVANMCLKKAAQASPDNPDVLKLWGFVLYHLEDFELCRDINQMLLNLYPQDAYALKGMGVCLAKLGDIENSVAYLQKAIFHAPDDFLDPYHDLAVVLADAGRQKEALKALQEGGQKSEIFQKQTLQFYQTLLSAKKE